MTTYVAVLSLCTQSRGGLAMAGASRHSRGNHETSHVGAGVRAVPAARDLPLLATELTQERGHELVDQHVHSLWMALAQEGAPSELAAEACQLAWWRLSQNIPSTVAPDEVGLWLLMTARIELTRAKARHQAQQRGYRDSAASGEQP